jgi:hypothetical protein
MVKMVKVFACGDVNGSTEEVPEQLLGKDGRIIEELARWPKDPLRVEANDERAALEHARWQRGREGGLWIDDQIGEVEYKKLATRPQTGTGGRSSSVHEVWLTKQEGDYDWHPHHMPPGPPSAE